MMNGVQVQPAQPDDVVASDAFGQSVALDDAVLAGAYLQVDDLTSDGAAKKGGDAFEDDGAKLRADPDGTAAGCACWSVTIDGLAALLVGMPQVSREREDDDVGSASG